MVSAHARAYAASFAAGRPVDSPVSTRLADGMACRTPEPLALEIIGKHVARIVEVTDDEIAAAIRMIYECTHNVAEGAGAAAVAAATQERGRIAGRRVAVILSSFGCPHAQPRLDTGLRQALHALLWAIGRGESRQGNSHESTRTAVIFSGMILLPSDPIGRAFQEGSLQKPWALYAIEIRGSA